MLQAKNDWVPIDGYTNVLFNSKAIYNNTITPYSVPKKKNHYIYYNICREVVSDNTIRVANQETDNNIDDMFTKIITAASGRFLLEKFTY